MAPSQFDSFSKTYNAVSGTQEWRAPASVLAAVEALGIPRDAKLRILDVGAGTGNLTALLRKLFPNAEFHAVDGSADMMRIGVEAGTLDADKMKVSDLKADPFPYEAGTFDLVVSSGTSEYLGSARRVLDEMARVAKPEGYVVSTFRANSVTNKILHGIGAVQNAVSFIPGISPIASKTTTSAAELRAIANGSFASADCSAPYAAYTQNLLHPLPVTLGPSVQYLTFSGRTIST